jgi:hypothetical protein
MMDATILPVSRGDNNARVRVASHLFLARAVYPRSHRAPTPI